MGNLKLSSYLNMHVFGLWEKLSTWKKDGFNSYNDCIVVLFKHFLILLWKMTQKKVRLGQPMDLDHAQKKKVVL